jgi:APA family basic amino acid/polyamine antiporter
LKYQVFTVWVWFAGWIFYALTVLLVIVLRRKRPDLRRPCRVSGYPFVPAAFLIAAACSILKTLLARPVEADIGSGIVTLGIPAYWLWERRSRAA